ncbi:hypothetical protein [Stutzerimonas stutzeri]|nr:hypothetical protein [Stutzerimonas stutzeri]GBC56568.1 hypothetical protein PSNTI_20350 [Stutzerimonas stutzeri]
MATAKIGHHLSDYLSDLGTLKDGLKGIEDHIFEVIQTPDKGTGVA